jgi:hypothetical protein
VTGISKQIDEFGDDLASDLLWSDPRIAVDQYEKSPRGCGRDFGEEIVKLTEKVGMCNKVFNFMLPLLTFVQLCSV